MKKVILTVVFICLMLSCVSVFAQSDTMKISMSGNTIRAKDIGTGKGITFTLPELENDDFYIYAIELGVFEKQYEEKEWHIYTDENGDETKKQYIENPASLTFNVDFGNPSDYRSCAKYKIGYRYYIQSIHDTSQVIVAGEEIKDGWRLVGEEDTTKASEEGFVFYKNALPEMNIESFTYKYHDVNGLMTGECSISELPDKYFPCDAFENGVMIQMTANDFDNEDILTVSYILEDAISDIEVASGTLSNDFTINVEITTQKVRVNAVSQIMGHVRPTEEYKHTIYYSTSGFYVVKNTAYNTKYHFELADRDINDRIKTTVKLVSKDNSSIYSLSESITEPTGTQERDIVFNMPYLDDGLNELPDGVYEMFITITELKNDGEEVVTHVDVRDCEVVIKRNAPPTPEINTNGNKVSITYPDESLAGSLNNSVVRSHYKCEYKTVKDGEAETNVYKRYTGEFDAGNFIVTALYTDIAGNTSVATKRIYADSEDGDGTDGILTGGNTITVEESRAADVYYIGIRRDKKSGINNSVFDFLE